MAELEKNAKPITISTDDARGALGPRETSRGDTLMPMLVGGLILIVVGMVVVFVIG